MDAGGIGLYFIIFCGCLVFSAFFSGSETALLRLDQARLIKLSETSRRGRLVREAVGKPEDLLGAILLGNNLFNVVGTAAGTTLALELWGQSSLGPTAGVLTIIFLVVAEITPKTLAAFRPESISLLVIYPLRLFIRIFRPVIQALTWVSRSLLRLMGQDKREWTGATREDLVTLVHSGESEGFLRPREQRMLRGVLDLEVITVEAVMMPLGRIKALSGALTVEEALARVGQWTHSRYPVFKGDMENIVGYVHLRDLLAADRETVLLNMVHDPIYVPESRSVQEQLLAFRREQAHLAFVVDEFGRVMGLVTLEDVLEEIVGEILDEYDTRAAPLKGVGDGWTMAGRLTVRDVNRLTGLNLPEGPYHTISGLVQTLAQKIPKEGETYAWLDQELRVEQMDGHAVGRVKITTIQPQPDDKG